MLAMKSLWALLTLFLLPCIIRATDLSGEPDDNYALTDEAELLLKIAREYRDGSGEVAVSLERAVHFFQYVMERGSNDLKGIAALELFKLHVENPNLKSESGAWQLLQSSSTWGNREAQHLLSSAMATGIFADGLIDPMNSTEALLLEYSAALSGDSIANLGMGYRSLQGVGLAVSCERALPHLELAANEAAQQLELELFYPPLERGRLSELLQMEQGIGVQRQSSELTDYYHHLAESGDAGAAFILGGFYAQGGHRLIPVDYELAIYYLSLAVTLKHTGANGLLSLLLVKLMLLADRHPDHRLSILYEQRIKEKYPLERVMQMARHAAKKNEANGIVALAMAHMNAALFLPVQAQPLLAQGMNPNNGTAAAELLNKCTHSHVDAGLLLGDLRMENLHFHHRHRGSGSKEVQFEINVALNGYSAAAALGNPVAQHRLAQLTARGYGQNNQPNVNPANKCETAATLFRSVAERSPVITQSLAQAFKLGAPALSLSSPSTSSSSSSSSDSIARKALWTLAPLAAAGIEVAQSNAAFLLLTLSRRNQCRYSSSHNSRGSNEANAVSNNHNSNSTGCELRALQLQALAANQGNGEALLQLGDALYYGRAGLKPSHAAAARLYQRAADLHHPQALFNLGLLHEVGDGVAQDFHLAKRFFDLAAEMDNKARTPRDVALLLLDWHKTAVAYLGEQQTNELLESMAVTIAAGRAIVSDLEKQVADIIAMAAQQASSVIHTITTTIDKSIPSSAKRSVSKAREQAMVILQQARSLWQRLVGLTARPQRQIPHSSSPGSSSKGGNGDSKQGQQQSLSPLSSREQAREIASKILSAAEPEELALLASLILLLLMLVLVKAWRLLVAQPDRAAVNGAGGR